MARGDLYENRGRGRAVRVAMPLLATVPRSELGNRFGWLAERQHDLTNALDLLFSDI